MREIEFFVLHHEPGIEQRLEPLLQAFEQRLDIRVNVTGATWDQGWMETTNFGLYGQGPDVSEIGTTWIGSMASMEALRPFSEEEVRLMGGPEAFFTANWQSSFLPTDNRPYAIPWLGDCLTVYYWKDALTKAGIEDPQTAFATPDCFRDTLSRLQQAGYPTPLALSVLKSNQRGLHEACSWIWSAGGSLMSADGRRVTFADEAALNGLGTYFSLLPFLPRAQMEGINPHTLFGDGQSVVMIAGPWHGIIGRHTQPWGERIGIARLLNTAFSGGSSLVIWNHSRHFMAALDLIRFIVNQPPAIPGSPHSIMLPVRADSFDIPSVKQDVFERTCLQALQTGRPLPTNKLWGAIEERLNLELSAIWADLFAHPDANVNETVYQHLYPLARRLNLSLKN